MTSGWVPSKRTRSLLVDRLCHWLCVLKGLTYFSATGEGMTGMPRHYKENLEILMMLAARWPSAFAVLESDRRPLKLGIRNEIAAALGTDTPPRLRQVLAWYCNGPSYLRHCVPGATRCDLDGKPAGEVTSDDAANARYKLKQRTAKRVEPSVAATPPTKSALKEAAKPAVPAPAPSPRLTGEQVSSGRVGLAGLREAARRRASTVP
jgi:sRNA-binding protein